MNMSRDEFRSFVGVDLHKCTVTLTAADPLGEVIQRLKINTKCVNKIEGWLLDLPRPSWLAVEACPFVEWFIDRYTSCVDRMDIADATELSKRRSGARTTATMHWTSRGGWPAGGSELLFASSLA